MAAPAVELTAIVLGHVDYGEADRIVRLISAERGLVSVLARGVRSSKKRFGGGLEFGNRVAALVRRGRGELDVLDSAELLDGRPHLRADLDRIALAAYLCDLVASMARPDHAEPRLYGLLDVGLVVLDAITEAPSPLFRLAFEAKALTFAGYAPRLDACAVCGEPFADEPLVYAPGAGGALHRRCGGGHSITAVAAAALDSARRTPLADLVDTAPPDCEPWLLYEHLLWQIGRPLRSKSLLASLEIGARPSPRSG